MGRFIPVLLIILISSFAEAKQISVVAVEENLIFTNTGEIFEAYSDNVLNLAKIAKEKNLTVEVAIDDTSLAADIFGLRNTILSLELKTPIERAPVTETTKNRRGFGVMSSYVTNLSSDYDAVKLFNSMTRGLKGRSECYNRAHVWSWELYAKFYNGSRIQTGKMWLFFTRKYIREFDYKWWFHVAPYLDVQSEATVVDRTFADKPLSRRNWTNMFMSNEAICPKISAYSQYKDFQYDAYCYTMQSSVHYWQPWHLEANEDSGEVRDEWQRFELKKAYRDAKGWFSRVPEL